VPALVLAVLAAACGAPRARPDAVPVAPAPTRTRVTVTLVWTAPVDLDLYVTDPALETAYFAYRRTRSGGVLARDARCADGRGPRLERVQWTDPPPGRYRVGVDFPEVCGRGPEEVPYRLVVEVDGERRETAGRARLLVRDPRAVEFDVPGPPGEEERR
jgi:hypothetical protein